MSYHPLNPAPNTPDPVKIFLRDHVDMQFHDVHVLLRLPMHEQGLDAGCNFAAANVLLALIGGMSRVLYKTKLRGDENHFKGVLKDYYPWGDELKTPLIGDSVTQEEGADILYEVVRNPLVHELGIVDRNKKDRCKVRNTYIDRILIKKHKTGLSEEQIEDIECSLTRPSIVPNTIVLKFPDENGNNTVDILVAALYWGVRRMAENLTRGSLSNSPTGYLSAIHF
jgi:hypothetical protein